MAQVITVLRTIVETNTCPIGCRSFGSGRKIAWSSVYNLSGSPISISLWFKSSASFEFELGNLIQILASGNMQIGISLTIASNTSLTFGRTGAVQSLFKTNSCANLVGNVWHNIVVTHDGSFGDYTKINMYLDGSFLNTVVYGENGNGEVNVGGNWYLGPHIMDYQILNGYLCQVGIWNYVLSGAQITNLANGYSPELIQLSNLKFYFPANTSSLNANPPNADGVNTLTTFVYDGPAIIYG